ncbi:NAD(P)-binding protein, partial [Stipitochalara longipes BDJ]
MPSILLFGATGLMGSHLVAALKKKHPTFPLTVYVRDTSTELHEYLSNKIGVDKIIKGDFSETGKISKLASDHDVVINCGSSWDMGLTNAIIAGLVTKYDEGRGKGRLIHVSGTGNFVDGRKDGKYAGPGAGDSKVWNDDDEEDMKQINTGMLNGGPDVAVLEAGKSGKLNTYIIFPSGVYGHSLGPVSGKALGVIQLLYKLQAEQLGFVPYVGEGSSLFQSLHVEDFPPFVLQVLDESLKTDTPKESVYARCYIASSQSTPWKLVSPAFARLLHAQGIVDSPEARSVPLEEAGEGELPNLQAGSMLFKNERAKRLGFKPVKEDVLEFLDKEL